MIEQWAPAFEYEPVEPITVSVVQPAGRSCNLSGDLTQIVAAWAKIRDPLYRVRATDAAGFVILEAHDFEEFAVAAVLDTLYPCFQGVAPEWRDFAEALSRAIVWPSERD